ncbi:putative beta-galactosidase [Colletotrichum scovillei]|uniref:Beta-galactosidase n=1 Tax=Colletotrichum scovillei TaxID=1209932 RepID=A0A9P7RCP5_9PEZI|nr:putative beta-galactosidase [Colletotrichum scovillei]KAG7071535.1 putative beta-galactosidase [Colletotrichum scovillei]KAG7079784.1 putative beta-galactosidase [Colletotrichum scovillei]
MTFLDATPQAAAKMANVSVNIPHLVQTDGSKQLVVKGEPFLMRAGELQNSSLSSPEYMETVWDKMARTNINTLLGSVSWEMIEPEEDKFDFSVLDEIISDARKHSMHLVLLWFGSFKNGLSSYTPAWVKTDDKRFPRVKLRKAGGRLETGDVLSIFSAESRKADAKAFGRLMEHLREVDESHSTVLMVQVENECGVLGDSRDGLELANEAFRKPVPKDLVHFLSAEWDQLHQDLREQNLTQFDRQTSHLDGSGDWESVFGSSPRTDELFMAYNYALYLNQVAAAGKAAYPIPLYTNVWMNYVGEDSDNDFPVVVGGGGMPGDYPSGGPVSNVLDVWMRFAPKLDFIGPDVYLNDYASSCAKYRHRNQPLFIPEQRRDDYGARRIWIAYGTYGAMGVAPFGVDTIEPEDSPFTKHYGLLKSVSPIVLEAQRHPDTSVGFCFDELPADSTGKDPSPVIRRTWGDFEITIERCFVFGKPGTGAGMVIHQGGGKFLLIGWGFQVKAKALGQDRSFTGILKFEEKIVEDEGAGRLKTSRVLNGDETRSGKFAMMPNEEPDYGGFPISVTIPARTMIAEVTFYSLS